MSLSDLNETASVNMNKGTPRFIKPMQVIAPADNIMAEIGTQMILTD